MAQTKTEQEFERFRRSGDPESLGRVFDAVAPQLLLVAAQLAPRHAEDLLQATFVIAIEQAERFDASRPLRPWLLGILANEARVLRRRNARTPDPEKLEFREPDDPQDLAASDEAVARIADAVDKLPEPYAQVVSLRIVHDLEPVQIARVLQISPGTVRSRLHRGLERLRESLPAGLASVALLRASEPTWAMTRARVLEAAVRVGPRPVSTSTSTTTFTKPLTTMTVTQKTLTTAALAVLAISGWQAARSSDPAPDSMEAASIARQADRTDPDLRVAHAGEREAPDATPIDQSPTDADQWFVAGRISGLDRDSAETSPIDGARVEVVLRRGEAERVIGEGLTSSDGAFHIPTSALAKLSVLKRHTGEVLVRATADGFLGNEAPRSGRTKVEPAIEGVELTLEPQRGLANGRLVSTAGVPIADAYVNLRWHDPEARPFKDKDQSTWTDAEGRFSIPFGDNGDYSLSAGSYGIGMARRRMETLTADRVVELGDIPLENQHAMIRARFVMSDGTPARGLYVYVRPESNPNLQVLQSYPRPRAGEGGPQRIAPVSHMNLETDEFGMVEATNLKAGRYVLRVRDELDQFQDFVADTGPHRQELTLEGQLMTIALVEADGSPLPGAQFATNVWSPEAAPDLTELTMGIRSTPLKFSAAMMVFEPDAKVRFLSPSGATWRFRGSVGNHSQPTFHVHRAEDGVGSAEISLVIEPLTQTGRIAFDLRRNDSSIYSHLSAMLKDPITGLPVFGGPDTEIASEQPWEVPVGRWTLVMRPGKPLAGPLRSSQEIERSVRIEHNGTTVIREAIEPRGLIRVRLTGEMNPEAAWKHVKFALTTGGETIELDGTLEIRRDDEGEAVISHSFGPSRAVVKPGRALVLRKPLPPGPAVLTVSAEGHQDVTRRVFVKADEIVDVEIPMTPN